MSNPTNNLSSDLDPYDRLAQMLDGGLFKLLPLPPSWANYVRAGYAPPDPSLLSAPAPAIPGFRKLPDLIETPAQPSIDSGPPSFDPLPIEPSPSFPSEPPGLDKAIARINAPPPGFHLTPGLGGFTQNASGPALSLPPLPPTMSAPSPLILANSGAAASTIGPSPGAGTGAGVSPIGTKGGITPYAQVNNAPLNGVDTTGSGSLAMNPPTGPRGSNSGIQLANGDSAGAVTIGDTPSGADLTAASQGFQAGASYVADRLNAIVNGAYSIFPGAGNVIYELGRGTGLLGSKEYNRSVQETSALVRPIQEMAQHPRLTLNAGREIARTAYDAEPLLPYYLAGRGLMGFVTGLGYAAMPGDFLRALDRGHTALDALILRGVSGIPTP